MGALYPHEHEVACGDRAANPAHELANLVQAVSGNLELLAARTTDETALRYLANARAAAQQLADLTLRLQSSSTSRLRKPED